MNNPDQSNPYTNNPYSLTAQQPNINNPGTSHTALPSFAASALPSFAANPAVKRQAKPPANSIPPPAPQLQKPAAATIEYTPRLDFAQLPEDAVEKYRDLHMTGDEMQTGDLINQMNDKFQSTPIDERESIAYFIYKCKNYGLKLWILIDVESVLTLPHKYVKLDGGE
jgi:hypothetical protein